MTDHPRSNEAQTSGNCVHAAVSNPPAKANEDESPKDEDYWADIGKRFYNGARPYDAAWCCGFDDGRRAGMRSVQHSIDVALDTDFEDLARFAVPERLVITASAGERVLRRAFGESVQGELTGFIAEDDKVNKVSIAQGPSATEYKKAREMADSLGQSVRLLDEDGTLRAVIHPLPPPDAWPLGKSDEDRDIERAPKELVPWGEVRNRFWPNEQRPSEAQHEGKIGLNVREDRPSEARECPDEDECDRRAIRCEPRLCAETAKKIPCDMCRQRFERMVWECEDCTPNPRPEDHPDRPRRERAPTALPIDEESIRQDERRKCIKETEEVAQSFIKAGAYIDAWGAASVANYLNKSPPFGFIGPPKPWGRDGSPAPAGEPQRRESPRTEAEWDHLQDNHDHLEVFLGELVATVLHGDFRAKIGTDSVAETNRATQRAAALHRLAVVAKELVEDQTSGLSVAAWFRLRDAVAETDCACPDQKEVTAVDDKLPKVDLTATGSSGIAGADLEGIIDSAFYAGMNHAESFKRKAIVADGERLDWESPSTSAQRVVELTREIVEANEERERLRTAVRQCYRVATQADDGIDAWLQVTDACAQALSVEDLTEIDAEAETPCAGEEERVDPNRPVSAEFVEALRAQGADKLADRLEKTGSVFPTLDEQTHSQRRETDSSCVAAELQTIEERMLTSAAEAIDSGLDGYTLRKYAEQIRAVRLKIGGKS